MRDDAPDDAHGPRDVDKHGVVEDLIGPALDGARVCGHLVHVSEVAQGAEVMQQVRSDLERRRIVDVAVLCDLLVL